jgi:hypothetical protein
MATSMFRDDPTAASRYLADQLTESERTAYEAALAQDPEVLRELEATARLKVGLRRLRDEGDLDTLVGKPRFGGSTLLVALAATVAAVVVGVGLWRSDLRTDRPQLLAATLQALVDQSGRVLPQVGTQAMFRRRAEAYDAVVELPAARGAIELRVQPDDVKPSSTYRATLSRIRDDNSEQPLGSVADLRLATDGFVTLYVDSSALTPGRYLLSIAGSSGTDAAAARESFVVKVVPRDGQH